MKLKMRASVISMLLLFFTLVLFYQNCSQDGSSGLFSESSSGGGSSGTQGSNTLTLKFINSQGQEIVPQNVDYDNPIGIILTSGIEAPANSGQKSIITCVYVGGSGQNPCGELPSIVIPIGDSPHCTSTSIGGWREMDCGRVEPSPNGLAVWTKQILPNGNVQYTNTNIFDVLRTAPNQPLPCDFPTSFTFYIKANDGNPLSRYQTYNLSLARPARCR